MQMISNKSWFIWEFSYLEDKIWSRQNLTIIWSIVQTTRSRITRTKSELIWQLLAFSNSIFPHTWCRTRTRAFSIARPAARMECCQVRFANGALSLIRLLDKVHLPVPSGGFSDFSPAFAAAVWRKVGLRITSHIGSQEMEKWFFQTS